MPYLQLDVNGTFAVDDKKRLAKKLCETYAGMMTVDIRRISIAIRKAGESSVAHDRRRAYAGIGADVRHQARPSARAKDGTGQTAYPRLCGDPGFAQRPANVKFTQHSDDEMYHRTLGGFSPDWSPGEA